MTNGQLYFAVGMPELAVITGLVISMVQISGIRAEIAAIDGDISEIRSDIKLLTGKVYELMK